MEKKIGVYLCEGCGLSEALDLVSLNKLAMKEGKAALCKSHPALCGPEGSALIREDLAKEGINTVVIGACSPRYNWEVFSFPPEVILERVNLREQVAWTQEPKHEDTQMLADDYLRMGLVKAKKTELPEPRLEATDKTILVVGGGITGLSAALEAADTGYSVVLVEKEAQLGGFLNRLHKSYPQKPPYLELEAPAAAEKVQAVQNHSKIKVLASARIEEISGQPGLFDVTVARNGSKEQFRAGAIIMATGFKPYDAKKLGRLGYGQSPNVVSSVEVEEMAKAGAIRRPSDHKQPQSVVFIQCAGSRDPAHLPYCSGICCMNTLKQAVYFREQNPEALVYIIYKDMRAPAQYENFYKQVQEQSPRTFFTKGEVSAVKPAAGDKLLVEAENTLVGEKIEIEADLVVLATGLVPVSADGPAIRAYEDAEKVIAKGDAGEVQLAEAKKKVEELKRHEGTAILNLTYRQGPDLPVLKYGFPDSHFICFPYETQRTGIYAAGAMRNPGDSRACMEDAAGAAMKAIQCVELTSQGRAVHPRAGDASYPDFFLQRCTQCKRCTEECPFGTLDEDEKGTPKPNPNRCRRCGVCMGSCPERIISFADYSVDMIGTMIKAIEVPEEDEEKPRVLALICENDAYPTLDMAALHRLKLNPYIRFIPLRCLGSVNLVWIADALSRGIDGILLIGCKYGDDYQCHFIKGSELCNRRMENIKETLDKLVLESDRVRVEQLAINEYDKLPALLTEFMETIERVGPNPYKGM
jgi:quinone-modifying oxidoreductase subunit QmoB